MLYIVATPIGNLEDITLRALNLLKSCDYILAEDTRRTGNLLNHYDIKKQMSSFNDINDSKKTPPVIQDLKQGKEIVLVSDSGMPGISDPGFYLVRECVKEGIQVSPVPGASAFISALVCSGLPTDRFIFYGFLPKTNSKRNAIYNEIRDRHVTTIFYESPYRIKKTLEEISRLPDKQVVIARELTKKFEEFIRGTPEAILEKLADKQVKGEIVLLVY